MTMDRQLVWVDPFEQMNAVLGGFDRRVGTTAASAPWAPVADVIEGPDEIVITAELPGVKDEDVDVHVGQGAVAISGERRLEDEVGDAHFRRIERSYGSFQRRFPLPPGVDENAVTAQVAYGVLRIVIKKPEQAGPRRVQITSGGD